MPISLRQCFENTFGEAFKYQLLSNWSAVPLTLRFRLALQRGGLHRSSLNPPRCSREQHGGVIHPNYKKTTSNKRNRRFLLGLRNRMAILHTVCNTLAKNSSFTSTPEGSGQAGAKTAAGTRQAPSRNRPAIIHASTLISSRQESAGAAAVKRRSL